MVNYIGGSRENWKRKWDIDIEEAKDLISKRYMLEKYAGCSKFSSIDGKIANWKSVPKSTVVILRRDVYKIPTDIKWVNPMGARNIDFKILFNSHKFKERDREWFKLRFNEGKTFEEIGEIYGLTKDGVHKRFKKLFRIISRNCSREEIILEIFLRDKLKVN